MQINRNGFVFRTAYTFTNRRDQPRGHVSACTLLWRFLWCGFWKVVVNIAVFALSCTLIGGISFPIWMAGYLLFGRKFEKDEDEGGSSETPHIFWPWLEWFMDRASVLGYTGVHIEPWPELCGFRILPIGVIIAAVIAWFDLLALNGAVDVWNVAGFGFNTLFATFATGLVTIEAGVLLVVFIGLLILCTQESELWQLVAVRYRGFKDRTCPILQIID